jgi:hypothetical protein
MWPRPLTFELGNQYASRCMYKVWNKFGQNGIKDVASRVFTKMLQKDWQNERQTDSSITLDWLIFGVLMPLSTIFQLYHGDQF